MLYRVLISEDLNISLGKLSLTYFECLHRAHYSCIFILQRDGLKLLKGSEMCIYFWGCRIASMYVRLGTSCPQGLQFCVTDYRYCMHFPDEIEKFL